MLLKKRKEEEGRRETYQEDDWSIINSIPQTNPKDRAGKSSVDHRTSTHRPVTKKTT